MMSYFVYVNTGFNLHRPASASRAVDAASAASSRATDAASEASSLFFSASVASETAPRSSTTLQEGLSEQALESIKS